MIPMLVDQSLSKSEYKAYLSTVRAYVNRIEEEQDRVLSDSMNIFVNRFR